MTRPVPISAQDQIFYALLREQGIDEPVKEFKFLENRRWRFDYAWIAAKVAVEVDGGIYGIGKRCPACGRRRVLGHTSVKGILRDMEKGNMAQAHGWCFLRFTPDQLMRPPALALITKSMKEDDD